MLHLHGCVKSFVLIFFCSSHTLEPLSISSFHNHPMFLRIWTKSTCPPLISMMIDGALQEKPQVPKFAFYDGPQLPTLLLHGSHTAAIIKKKKSL
jgi:hypothetical protein